MSHPPQYKSATPKHHCWNFIAHPLNREHYRVLQCIYTLTVLSTKSWDGKDQDHCHARYCRRMCTTCTVGDVLSLQRLTCSASDVNMKCYITGPNTFSWPQIVGTYITWILEQKTLWGTYAGFVEQSSWSSIKGSSRMWTIWSQL